MHTPMWRAVESSVQQAINACSSAYARMLGTVVRPSKRDLRGLACHCPSDLALHLLHSEGLRETCDVVIDFDSNVSHPHRRQVPLSLLSAVGHELEAGDTVYVKADRMHQFAESIVPHIRQPIILVTGDSDASVVNSFRNLLENPIIGHWFAQNCDIAGDHPKLTPIPIGIDNPIYTKLEKRLGFLLTMAMGKTPFDASVHRNDMGCQRTLQRISAGMTTRTSDRPPRALCTFHQNQKLVRPNLHLIPERLEAFSLLKDEAACHFVETRLSQVACWQLHEQFAFQVSPRGNGLDCFRTWESLYLGTIPIVKTSSLDTLYRRNQLPVVIVESFREVTDSNLRKWQRDYAPMFDQTLVDKLTVDHWATKIQAAKTKIQQRLMQVAS